MCLAKDKSPLMRRHTSLFGAGSARNALRSHYGKHDVSMIPSPMRDYYLEMGVSLIRVSLHFHLISWCFPLQAPSLTWLKHEVMESAKSVTPCDCSSNVQLEQRFSCFFVLCVEMLVPMHTFIYAPELCSTKWRFHWFCGYYETITFKRNLKS